MSMALQHTVTKQYLFELKVFAGAFTHLIYGGKQVIQHEQLIDPDATQYAIPYREDEDRKPEASQKYCDALKALAFKTDEHCTYLVLGIKN